MKKFLTKSIYRASMFIVLLALSQSCSDLDKYEPLGANSIADATPPSADFSFSQGVGQNEEWKDYTFANLSSNAITYLWEFDDNTTSSDSDAEKTYPGEGMYSVTLTATDGNGVSSTVTKTLEIVEPEVPDVLIPEILEPGFDNGDAGDDPVEIDSRAVWRNSDLGGVLQITGSSGYHDGNYGGKLPESADRIGYQEIGDFTPNTDYVLSFRYRLKDDVSDMFGVLNVLMVTPTTDPADVAANTVASVSFSEDVVGTSELATGTLSFNSGTNTTLAIYFFNELDEAYIDTFTLAADD